MGIIDDLSKGLEENLAIELNNGEKVLRHELATWRESALRTVSVDLFLTNYRLIVQRNTKSEAIATSGGVVGGALGGGLAGAAGGYVGGKLSTAGLSSTPLQIPLTSIIEMQPSKYVLFGFIPTRNTVINLYLSDGEKIVLVLNHRDEWLSAIKQAKNNLAQNPPNKA